MSADRPDLLALARKALKAALCDDCAEIRGVETWCCANPVPLDDLELAIAAYGESCAAAAYERAAVLVGADPVCKIMGHAQDDARRIRALARTPDAEGK